VEAQLAEGVCNSAQELNHVKKEWTEVYPNSILEKSNSNNIQYALLTEEEKKELLRLGYRKNKAKD
jgi:hypothetical protein